MDVHEAACCLKRWQQSWENVAEMRISSSGQAARSAEAVRVLLEAVEGAELGRVRAERDALLAACVSYEAPSMDKPSGVTFSARWVASVPHVTVYDDGSHGTAFDHKVFRTLAEAESAILSAALAAAEQRAKVGGGGVTNG
jgi:hypothetical protein